MEPGGPSLGGGAFFPRSTRAAYPWEALCLVAQALVQYERRTTPPFVEDIVDILSFRGAWKPLMIAVQERDPVRVIFTSLGASVTWCCTILQVCFPFVYVSCSMFPVHVSAPCFRS